MRFTIRKFATWLFTAGCIFLVTFNFYNRHVWVMTSGTRPWGQDFDSEIEHERVHHPHMPTHIELVTYNRSNVVVLNKTSTNENLKYHKPTTLKPGEILWPDLEFYDDDRILSQLRYKPSSLAQGSDENPPLKKIIVYSGLGSWNVKRGRQQFLDQKCLVNTCELADNKADADHADAVLVNSPVRPWTKRPPHQIWIIFQLESPYHSPGLNGFSNVFNWTATYRHDSDIVAPYERFTPYNENVLTLPQNRSYAEGKTKQVAWFVSNCGGRNGRQNYVQELSKHINVDIYGSCGKLKCPRHSAQKCFDMLNKDYKFYLAFENSNCRDYITEKFFVNGLQ